VPSESSTKMKRKRYAESLNDLRRAMSPEEEARIEEIVEQGRTEQVAS
jgi:hypothetical protein